MRRRIRFSRMHSFAAIGSLTTYRPPECRRPWYRPEVPLPKSPLSMRSARSPRIARSRRTPAPVAPPPTTRTSQGAAIRTRSPPSRRGLPRRFNPVECPGDRLPPEAVLLLPLGLVQLRRPFLVLGPVRPKIVDRIPETDGQAGGVGSAKRGRFGDLRPDHRHAEHVR